jgi:HAMP domain-containing protein
MKGTAVLRRLHLRSKIILSSCVPILAIVLLAAIGFTTFQHVKVNGPQYKKIASAKDLEADILPPPGYLVETHLIAALLTKSTTIEEFNAYVATLNRLRTEFEQRHSYWQTTLARTGPTATQMRAAFVDGRRYLTLLNDEYIPAARAALIAGKSLERLKQGDFAEKIFVEKLTPLYAEHRKAIDATVSLSTESQRTLESQTRYTVDWRLRILGIITLFVLISSVALALLSARSISRPIRELTKDATKSAEFDLPAVVAKIQAGARNSAILIDRSPFESDETEIGGLARAFGSMRATAVGLASEQAAIRRNVSDNLVNIARRNQLLLKRTLGSISSLEKDERDPARLERLFELDHLTTRMRRNAESLLVLAGSEGTKLWTTPMVMGDVIRSALSQIEDYSRVDFSQIDPSFVKGQCVSDINHMLAEFIENATHFSPPTSRVTILGRQRLDGYSLVITDDGVGMTAEALEQANMRLSSPGNFDNEPTKVLGHVVAGHLAARYAITITMGESTSSGVAVQIHLPTTVLEDPKLVEISHGKQRRGFDSAEPAAPMRKLPSPDHDVATLSLNVAGMATSGSTDDRSNSDGPSPLAEPNSLAPLPKRNRSATPSGQPTAAAPIVATPRDAMNVRSALASLQRGVQAAEQAAELGEVTRELTAAGLPKRKIASRLPQHTSATKNQEGEPSST